MRVDVEVTVWCESVRAGCTFSARITDGANARFFAGQGATALEAIAWALDDFVRRAVLGMPHTMARLPDAKPGDGLAAPDESAPPPSSRTKASRDALLARAEHIPDGPALAQDLSTKAGCFERSIAMTARPRLFSMSAGAISTPTTPRRAARGGRR